MVRALAYLTSMALIGASMAQATPKLADSAAVQAGIAGWLQDADQLTTQGFAYDAVAQIAALYGLKAAPRPQAQAKPV